MRTGTRRPSVRARGAAGAAVTVIVPTIAAKSRAQQLLRAIDSIHAQAGIRATPLVVLNGNRYDPDLRDFLSRRTDIRYVYRAEGSLPRALQVGRSHVDTEFFAELDDDDELLPDALSVRQNVMREDSSADLVVTSGYFQENGRRALNFTDFSAVQANPVEWLLRKNWLASCAGLYRTCRIGDEFFAAIPAYLEWTHIALHIALERNVRFVSIPTFVCHLDTSGSLSKSRDYVVKQETAIRSLLQLRIPPRVRRQLRAKLAGALHAASNLELSSGRYLAAWKLHLLSLCHPGGIRYASYTRHLIAPPDA